MKLWSLAVASALAVPLGWILAPPGVNITGSSELAVVSLPQQGDLVRDAQVRQGLHELYQRQAWSAAPPQTQAQADEPAAPITPVQTLPGGLDRFNLVALVRVRHQPPEAMFIDTHAEQLALPPSLRAIPGEFLRDSDILLQQIENTSVLLRLGDESRRLDLFRRDPAPTALTDRNSS